jgi:glyoxylase-like metal-dependent hydrolase (beta-lactamase superfamily II)
LFSGDIVMKSQPAFASPYSSLKHWLDSLFLFQKLQPKIIVPSHGPMGDAGLITGYQAYLTTIRDRTAALKKEGRTADQAVELVTKELEGKYPDRGRLGGAIRVAFSEAP